MTQQIATTYRVTLGSKTRIVPQAEAMDVADAMVRAGKTRLRPIMMTTMALIAGTIPIAIGLNEASRQRTSMGVAIVGGLISSTLLTLVVVPAAYSFIDRYRMWSLRKMAKLFGVNALE
jgi:HAE1 family hydrophobic/amphiphilic exporter-1